MHNHQILLTRVLCRYDGLHIQDIEAEVAGQFARNDRGIERIRSNMHGARIAVAVGSRGISNLASIVRSVVREIRKAGADPFIVPAMGSHGGATAEGQETVLAAYGVTEQNVGAPVRSSMETVDVPSFGLDIPLYMDRNAWESDGVILVNRIKVHTDFHGRYESGLVKMSVIGLGKHDQATAIHSFGVRGLRERLVPASERLLASGKILAGVGIVENAYDQTQIIRLIPAERILEEEPELLEQARRNMPSLPVDDIDVLVLDRIGKDISGSGMDTNIVGRIRVPGQEEPSGPRVASIVAAGLTPASHGNAIGVGLADVITQNLYDAIDFRAMNENVVTSSFFERGKIPLVADTDRHAVEYAIRNAAVGPTRAPRVARIRDTLHPHDLLLSPELALEAARHPSVTIVEEGVPLFDGDRFSSFPPPLS